MDTAYEILKWDTAFFGFPVAKIDGNGLSEQDLRERLSALKNKAKLVYYASPNKLEAKTLLREFNGLLVDEKTTFFKEAQTYTKIDANITEYKEEMNFKDLLSLGIESGVYSRFKIDANIGANKYEELYKTWVINSVNHKLADKVYVYILDNQIAGMITLGIKNNKTDIGIVAVKANARGKGIGKALLTSADVFSNKHRLSAIQVVTQGINAPAMALYKSGGYNVGTIAYFYHFWL